MLTTVAVLIILLGLMVDLAGYVRNRSANDLTRQVLAELDQAMAKYVTQLPIDPATEKPIPANIHRFTAGTELSEDEMTLLKNARQNNRDAIATLSAAGLLKADLFGRLPPGIYDGSSLNDAWDTPIVFMPASHSKIGMAPSGAGFFFSAGPDRMYKTREDNLYSYEVRAVTQ
jgi:hypothetical protein